MTNAQIQEVINGMNNGDTLIFEKNAVFENITIYIEKSIKVIGNNSMNCEKNIEKMINSGVYGFSIARAVISGNLDFNISQF